MNTNPRSRPIRQSVVIINGGLDVVDVLDGAVGPGGYDVSFVHMEHRTHGRVKALCPDLIVLCTRLDDPAGFQLLTMLKLDPDTRHIPVLTFTTEEEGHHDIGSAVQLGEDEFGYPAMRPGLQMN